MKIATLAAVAGALLSWALPGSLPLTAQTADDKPAPRVMVLPATTEDCLKLMASVLERAVLADLLDDQLDEAETALAGMEEHCLDKRFGLALETAKSVDKLVASNK